jgi:sugar phosphate permease
MSCLVIAGEAIFGLPFHVARFFRPTLLAVLGTSNTELGAAQAAYGVCAMIAYLPGGPLADRFPARKLLALSLLLTGLGGFYFATFPPSDSLWALFGYWGLSTILLFWAALIRATRAWGGSDEQGRAYGLLDGGRGVFAALMATGAALLFRLVFPDDADAITAEQRRAALRLVIHAYSAVTLGAAALVWYGVPDDSAPSPGAEDGRGPPRALRRVVALPEVWLQALIVVCAYVAYKGFDDYSLFAHQTWGMSEIEVASLTSGLQWIRPIAAVGAGLWADRWASSKVVIVCFALLLVSDGYFAVATPVPAVPWLLVANAAVACAAMFGLRGVYFALFEEASVPTAVTGTAVGLVSVIGYTPDVFVGVVAGALLDRYPGLVGHQLFFAFLGAFALMGLGGAVAFRWVRGTGGSPSSGA